MARSALRDLQPQPEEYFTHVRNVIPAYRQNTATASPVEPSFRDRVGQGVYDFMGGSNSPAERARANRWSDNATMFLDFAPGTGDAMSASDAYADYQRGNYGAAALGGGLTALGVIPGVRPAAKALRAAVDPARMAQIMEEVNRRGLVLPEPGMEPLNAAGRALAGKRAADVIRSQPPMKPSEALGQLMEDGFRRITTTQADRTRVGGGNIGGAAFPAISTADPAYDGKVWGVMDSGTASRLTNLTSPDTVWTTMLGSATQLKTNPIVFDKLKRGFLSSMKQGNLSDDLASKINHNLRLTFGDGADIRDPAIWRQADTFDKRAALADVMMGQGIPPSKGGVALGGEKSGKGVIFKPTEILKNETERGLLHPEHGGDVPTFAAGPRLFSLNTETYYKPDLHPGFPTLLGGEDFGVNISPTPTEIFLPDWHASFREQNPTRSPGYYDLALGMKGQGLPSQELNDKYIKWLRDAGYGLGGGAIGVKAAIEARKPDEQQSPLEGIQ